MRTSNQISGKRIILVLCLVAVAIGCVRASVGKLTVVEGESMLPTFHPDDVVRARALTEDLRRGDIVILTDFRGDKIVKRILGLPGDKITIYRGFVYVGTHRISEPYLARRTYTFNSDPQNERPVVWRLKSDQYFVLGDNRLESCDSRHFGPVQRDQIQQLVALPENAAKPEFCHVELTDNGRTVPAVTSTGPVRSRLTGF